ncbi:MAG TPA: hypothetical protein VLD39_00005 [Gammaproteobacteria bacterium]|nr:hypothetical protein [Gammaproteobacteria bacterium]
MSTREDMNYELVSIDETKPPRGSEGADWFRYRISQGDNVITGYRRGSLRTVKRDVKTIVIGLNERRSGKRKPAAGRPAKKTAKN